jgi:hypothetical protein
MTLTGIRSKAEFIAHLNPRAWEMVHPHGPFAFSNAHVDLMVADVVKNVSAVVADKTIGREIRALSKEMAQSAGSAIAASWEDGDICPPWPWPWPGPRPWFDLAEPEPIPWAPIVSAEQIELAHILAHLSGLTTSKDYNAALKSAATQIARGAVTTLADDFEKCGTVPRRPFPRPRG